MANDVGDTLEQLIAAIVQKRCLVTNGVAICRTPRRGAIAEAPSTLSMLVYDARLESAQFSAEVLAKDETPAAGASRVLKEQAGLVLLPRVQLVKYAEQDMLKDNELVLIETRLRS